MEEILRDPAHYERIVAEVRAVAEEIAADPTYADEGPIGPDDETRARFREFARKQLGGTNRWLRRRRCGRAAAALGILAWRIRVERIRNCGLLVGVLVHVADGLRS